MVRFVTTPSEITDEILSFCNSINTKSTPQYIPCNPHPKTLPLECFPNVDYVVSNYEGEPVNGWVIWQRANALIEAEAHAVWKSPDGVLVDVTPHSRGEKNILFLPDVSVIYEGKSIKNIRQALTNSPLIQEFISLFEQRDKFMMQSSTSTFGIPTEMYNRMLEIEHQLLMPAGKNDLCPCGSALKFKRCCGK